MRREHIRALLALELRYLRRQTWREIFLVLAMMVFMAVTAGPADHSWVPFSIIGALLYPTSLISRTFIEKHEGTLLMFRSLPVPPGAIAGTRLTTVASIALLSAAQIAVVVAIIGAQHHLPALATRIVPLVFVGSWLCLTAVVSLLVGVRLFFDRGLALVFLSAGFGLTYTVKRFVRPFLPHALAWVQQLLAHPWGLPAALAILATVAIGLVCGAYALAAAGITRYKLPTTGA